MFINFNDPQMIEILKLKLIYSTYSTDSFGFNRPHYAATINSDSNIRDLIPYNPNELKGPVDDNVLH